MTKTNAIVYELTDRDLDRIGLRVARAFKGEASSITVARNKRDDSLEILVYGHNEKLLSKISYNETSFKMQSSERCKAKKEDVYDAITEYICNLFGEMSIISDLMSV